MATETESEYPSNVTIDAGIKEHLRKYYTAVDTLGGHDQYANSFAQDAVLTLPTGSQVHGRDGMRTLHKGMWGNVEKRKHRADKIFPFGNDAMEIMILGSVEYWGKDGSNDKKDMACHFRFKKDDSTGMVEIATLSVWLK